MFKEAGWNICTHLDTRLPLLFSGSQHLTPLPSAQLTEPTSTWKAEAAWESKAPGRSCQGLMICLLLRGNRTSERCSLFRSSLKKYYAYLESAPAENRLGSDSLSHLPLCNHAQREVTSFLSFPKPRLSTSNWFTQVNKE